MSKIDGANLQIGESGTATQNCTVTANGDGSFTLARGNIGATTQDLLTIDASGNIAFPADANLFGSETFTSAEQTLTQNGSLTIPHSLSSAPFMVQGVLICKTTEFGYSVGDEVIVPLNGTDQATAYGVGCWSDATNVYIRFGNVANIYVLINNTTGGINAITNTSWKLIIRAVK